MTTYILTGITFFNSGETLFFNGESTLSAYVPGDGSGGSEAVFRYTNTGPDATAQLVDSPALDGAYLNLDFFEFPTLSEVFIVDLTWSDNEIGRAHV